MRVSTGSANGFIFLVGGSVLIVLLEGSVLFPRTLMLGKTIWPWATAIIPRLRFLFM